MATRKTTLVASMLSLIALALLLIFPLVLSKPNGQQMTINQWCDKTPHPGPCHYFMSHFPEGSAQIPRSDFRRMLVQAAIGRAAEAHRRAQELGPKCETGPEQAARKDCLKLYENTVYHLNRTLELCSGLDAQTWLSSALTNVDTCLAGSAELNVSGLVGPVATGFNVTELLSNTLAVNAANIDQINTSSSSSRTTLGFPKWVTWRERRLLDSSVTGVKASLVVAKDGSGRYRTIQAAINAAAKRRVKSRIVIHVKRGVYRENIEVGIGNDNIMLVGDGMRLTIVTSGRSVGGGYTTYSSATAGIDGLRFIASGITFRNTAGPTKGQAVALRSSSDLSVFYRCGFEGYQDTLMVHSQRQFYKECYIYGTIDFIFGNAAVVLQNCLIYVRKPLWGQVNVITAQGRNDPYQNTAISIHDSHIRAAADLLPVVNKFKTYMGRPWKLYSRVVVMRCYLDKLVSPSGWLEWNRSNFGLKTLYYGEYRNVGPASSTRRRVKWPGFHVITRKSDAATFSVGTLIAGKSWLPATGVPYRLDI